MAEGIRINKFLSEAGVCSRREADRQVENGNVTIDGKIAVMGDRIFDGQKCVLWKRSHIRRRKDPACSP